MNWGNKKFLSLLIVAILVSAGIAVVVTIGIKNLEDEEEVENPLNVKIFSDKTKGTLPLKISFSSIVTNSKGEVKYKWDFGNGNISTEREPQVTYSQNGTYTCNLTITDDKKDKATDSIIITTTKNEPPTISISLSSKNPSRPTPPLYPIVKSNKWLDNFQGAKLRRAINLIKTTGMFSSLLNKEGFLTVEAIANDPEGDEIVSYKWIIEPRPFGWGSKKVSYSFEGQKITFPLLYIWGPANQKFDLTLIVEDSAGNIRETSTSFTVQKSQLENTISIFQQLTNTFRNFFWNLLIAPGLTSQQKDDMIDFGWNIAEKIPLPLFEAWFKYKIFSIAFKWNLLSITDITATALRIGDIITPVIEKYPDALKPFFNQTLNFVKNFVENIDLMFLNRMVLPVIQPLKELWGISNYLPEIINPNPGNGDKVYNINYPNVTIKIRDFDAKSGEMMNVSIGGEYVQNESWDYSWVEDTNEVIFSANLTNALPANENIYWSVSVIDFKGRKVEETFNFKT